jgi:hypothetical protein
LRKHARQAVDALSRQALHAAQLGFEHPTRLEPMQFESELPEDFQMVVDALRGPPKATTRAKPGNTSARPSAPRRKA